MTCRHPDKEQIRHVISRVLPDVISDLIAEYVIICTKKYGISQNDRYVSIITGKMRLSEISDNVQSVEE